MSGGWGERLDKHFQGLQAERNASGAPVFALEHGLAPHEVTELSHNLHSQLRGNAFFPPDWLQWVVYGAELGYAFDGQDYWTNFEERTPYWRNYYHRRWLRNAFKRFHLRYQGFVPIGAWASQFSIIAWPITHAILPRDLQTQLAHTLYSLRFTLAGRIEEEPEALGGYIAARGEGSSRFRNFLQQEEMVGRIAQALLGVARPGARETILPSTLERIVKDLETGQSARAWLGDARRVIERARINGVGQYGHWLNPGSSGANPTEKPSIERPLALKPTLSLVRAEGNEWLVLAQFPSYRPLAEISSEIERFLKTTRCAIQGMEGFRPAGWLLPEGQRRALVAWPDPDRPIVQFEKRQSTVDRLMISDSRINPGPVWPFEIGIDGRAREVVTKRLQPGKRYIVISRTPFDTLPFGAAALMRCNDCFAQEVVLPAQVTNESHRLLKAAGLIVARTISVWPAGLSARRWDGQSQAEWLEGESPTFGIGADHDIQKVCVSVNDEPPFDLPEIAADRPVFLSIPGLHAGLHRLRIDAQVAKDDGGFFHSSASIEITIAAPVGWRPGTTEFKGLVPTVFPTEPSVDDLFEERIGLTIAGPQGYAAKVSLELFDAGGAILASAILLEADLPCDEAVWRRASAPVLRNWSSPWAHLSASSASLIISSDDLGIYKIPLYRDVRPVRFVWHTDGKTTHVRLIDEHQGRDPVAVTFYPFAVPCAPTILNLKGVEGFEPPGQGGLFVLRYGKVSESLVISMPQHIADLSQLAPEPDQTCFPTGDGALLETQACLSHWRSAALAGPLASLRRERLVQHLEQHFFKLLCGDKWFEAERAYLRSEKTADDLRTLAMSTEAKPSFWVLLNRHFSELRRLDEKALVVRFCEWANRYGVANEATSRAAMSISENGGSGADEKMLALVQPLGKSGWPILRAARLMRVAEIPTDVEGSGRVAS